MYVWQILRSKILPFEVCVSVQFLMTMAGCSWRRRPLLTQLVKQFIGHRTEIWEKEMKEEEEKKVRKDKNKTIL